MKYFIFIMFLFLTACCNNSEIQNPEFIANIDGCKMYAVIAHYDRVYTTICPNGNASTKYDVREGKVTKNKKVDTVIK